MIKSIRVNSWLSVEWKTADQNNSSYGGWHGFILGRSIAGSILDPSLFNIFLINLFFIAKDIDIASYADDNTHTPYDNKLIAYV